MAGRGGSEPGTGVKPDHGGDFEQIHRIQRPVQARGWAVPSFMDDDLDTDGMAILQVSWDYLPAFGGIDLDEDQEDEQPRKPLCSFPWTTDTGGDIKNDGDPKSGTGSE